MAVDNEISPGSLQFPSTFLEGVSAIFIHKHLLFQLKEDLQRQILTRLRLKCEENGGRSGEALQDLLGET